MKERIINVHWKGPYLFEDAQKEDIQPGYVLYQIYGLHHLYGSDVLLYIGKTEEGLNQRLSQHGRWIAEEYDKVRFRMGSLGIMNSWDDWEEEGPWDFPEEEPELIGFVESLLIYSHQPVYNTMNKNSAGMAKGLRVFNTGEIGRLFPEVSYEYYFGSKK